MQPFLGKATWKCVSALHNVIYSILVILFSLSRLQSELCCARMLVTRRSVTPCDMTEA